MMQHVAHLGAVGASGAQYANIGVTGAGGVATALAPAAMVPIIGAAVVGVGIALALIFARKGPQQKIEASKIADDAEKQLKLNLDGYLAGPRTRSSQAAALANADYAFAQLRQMWSDPNLGEPGQRAIKERLDPSACKWRDSSGQCFNWVTGYRDPIANDPQVKDDAAAALEQAAGMARGIPPLAWLGLAVIVGAAIL